MGSTLPPLRWEPELFAGLEPAALAELCLDEVWRVELAAAGWPPGAVSAVTVARAPCASAEGAEVIPRPDGARVILRLRPARLGERERLILFLRHELAHVADLIDPAFGYAADPRLGGAWAEAVARGRYRTLWCASVDARLARAGRIPAALADAWVGAARIVFGLPRSSDAPLAAWLAGARPDHALLSACAATPECLATVCPGLSR